MNIIAFEAEGGYKLAITLDKKDLAFAKAIFLSDMHQGLTYEARKWVQEPVDNWTRPSANPAISSNSIAFLLDLIWLASDKENHQISTRVISENNDVVNILRTLRQQATELKTKLTNNLIVTKIKVKMTK
mgnify:CR=1 FL=1